MLQLWVHCWRHPRQELKEGTQRQVLEQRLWDYAACSLAPYGLLTSLPYSSQQSLIKKTLSLEYKPIWWKDFLNWGSFFPDDSGPCQVDIKLASAPYYIDHTPICTHTFEYHTCRCPIPAYLLSTCIHNHIWTTHTHAPHKYSYTLKPHVHTLHTHQTYKHVQHIYHTYIHTPQSKSFPELSSNCPREILLKCWQK